MTSISTLLCDLDAESDGPRYAGLRYTITERNAEDLEGFIALLDEVGDDRICFFDLDYTGRGSEIVDVDRPRQYRPTGTAVLSH